MIARGLPDILYYIYYTLITSVASFKESFDGILDGDESLFTDFNVGVVLGQVVTELLDDPTLAFQ
jgi:hypothetical protein